MRPNTPGILGYLLAFAVAFGIFELVTLPFAGGAGVEAAYSLQLLLYVMVYVSFFTFGLPFFLACGVVLALHLLVRWVESQVVHLLAAAFGGLVLAAVLALLVDHPGERWLLLVAMWVSMAIGRASVIPRVAARREQLASAAPVRVL